jgi:hypothetical protein
MFEESAVSRAHLEGKLPLWQGLMVEPSLGPMKVLLQQAQRMSIKASWPPLFMKDEKFQVRETRREADGNAITLSSRLPKI